MQHLLFLNLKFQASSTILCPSTAWLVLDLVRNPEDRFSHDAAQMISKDSSVHFSFPLKFAPIACSFFTVHIEIWTDTHCSPQF